ncbi:MAG: diguanylate cyclase [Epsilonproteobacteria bacterium]|nr:diguanylate cyclase [Campylobacterota bacterium]
MKVNEYLKKLTCLYVEDEDFIRDAFLMMIKRYFKEVYVGKNGEEGLELYKKHTPDIIISDIRMPKKDGIAMVKEIKELNPHAYVIFITAFSDNDYLKEAIDLGVEGYITKPVDKKKLLNKLNFIANVIKNQRENEELIALLKQIFENQIEATILYEEGKPKLMNKKFTQNFEPMTLEEFIEKYNIDLNKKTQQIEIEKEDYKRIYNLVIDKINEKFILLSLFDVTNYENEIFKDQLTNVYNRKYLPKAIEKLIGKDCCIITLDIDDFKHINDTYGHPVGDEVLKNLAKVLTENLRKNDVVIRFGGEEFIIFLDCVGEIQTAKMIAENLRKKVEEFDFKVEKITCSFGVACERIDTYKDFDKLYDKADKALYLAKQNGKNRVEVFN